MMTSCRDVGLGVDIFLENNAGQPRHCVGTAFSFSSFFFNDLPFFSLFRVELVSVDVFLKSDSVKCFKQSAE